MIKDFDVAVGIAATLVAPHHQPGTSGKAILRTLRVLGETGLLSPELRHQVANLIMCNEAGNVNAIYTDISDTNLVARMMENA